MRTFSRPTARTGGFTLIELMIAVAIVAILAAIAYPAYTESVMRSNRAEAKAALLENAQFLERNYTETSPPTYAADTSGAAIALPISQAPRTGTALYTISATTLTASSFTLTAAPVAGRRMAGDRCASFTLNELGQKGLSGSPTAAAAECWER